MKVNISSRDKRLLCISGIALFLVLFVRYGVVEMLAQRAVLEESRDAAQQVQAEMQQRISLAQGIDDIIAQNEEKLAAANGNFYDTMANDEIDALVTGVVLDHNLVPLNLIIAEASAQPITAYFASQQAMMAAAMPAPEPAATDAQAPPAETLMLSEFDAPITAAQGYILTSVISGKAAGTHADFLNFLDDLDRAYPSMHLNSYAITQTSYVDAANAVAVNEEFAFSISVYMCDKTKAAA